jgi:hypothetical protein
VPYNCGTLLLGDAFDFLFSSLPMFYHDKRTQYKVRVEKPNPAFARMLQQAIGGIEGEMRVCL